MWVYTWNDPLTAEPDFHVPLTLGKLYKCCHLWQSMDFQNVTNLKDIKNCFVPLLKKKLGYDE